MGSFLSVHSLKDSRAKGLEGLLLEEGSLNCTSFYLFVIPLVTLQEEEHSVLLYNDELILVTIYYKKVMIYCKKVLCGFKYSVSGAAILVLSLQISSVSIEICRLNTQSKN